MEIGLVAGCVTIATRAASSLHHIYEFYKSYDSVPDSIGNLESDVKKARAILEIIEAQGLSSSGTGSPPDTEKCQHVLKTVEKFAEKHSKRLSKRRASAFFTRLSFTWEESEIQKLRNELRWQIDYLTKFYQLASSSSTRHGGGQTFEAPPISDDGSGKNSLSDTHMREKLIDAANSGNVERINEYLLKGVEPNYHSRSPDMSINGYAPIHLAVKRGHMGCLKELIKGHADVNIVTCTDRETPLHIAASAGHLALVRSLISNGANVDAEDVQDQTPLLVASQEEIQLVLLDASAGANVKSPDGVTALQQAISSGSVRAVRKLVEKGANVNARDPNGLSPIWLAYNNVDVPEEDISEIIQILLLSSADRNSISDGEKRALFLHAIQQDKLHVVRAVLNIGPDILWHTLSQGMYPVHIAAREGSARILAELVRDNRVNGTDSKARSPLHHAVAAGNEACVQFLLEARAAALRTEDSDGLAPLHLAFSLPSDAIAERIIIEYLAMDIPINLVDSRGRYPIHLASTAEKVELWKRYEGNINTRYTYRENVTILGTQVRKEAGQRSIIHYSVLYQAPAVVEALIKHGASLDLVDNHKRNPMEALCATEAVWKSADGKGLSQDRVAVLKILMKHMTFTNNCRAMIAGWKDKNLQVALGEKLPWRSLTQMATAAMYWTCFTAIPTAVVGVVVVAGAVGRMKK